jgi:hypothetical protein
MRDSPSGERYGRRDPNGRIVEAYGFDFAPIAMRHGKFVGLAEEGERRTRDRAPVPPGDDRAQGYHTDPRDGAGVWFSRRAVGVFADETRAITGVLRAAQRPDDGSRDDEPRAPAARGTRTSGELIERCQNGPFGVENETTLRQLRSKSQSRAGYCNPNQGSRWGRGRASSRSPVTS